MIGDQTMKQLTLTGLEQLELRDSEGVQKVADGYSRMTVHYCAVCRTDAKMWQQGHRDLVFPRVPGHEMVVSDAEGTLYLVWPGKSCGRCIYCLEGRENLCDEMKITGFHHDGGFAESVMLPTASLIPLTMPSNPKDFPDPVNPLGGILEAPHIGCFAEPTGCVFNALEKLALKPDQRVIIYGGGTVGLIAALACKDLGAIPLVIEKQAEKIEKTAPFLEAAGIHCVKDTVESEFDAVINACADPIAFDLGIVKAAKGGRISFFSGLSKNEHIETNLINLLHYKEVAVRGAYGLTRQNMVDALPFLVRNASLLEHLVEGIIAPEAAPAVMPKVLAGSILKYILAFGENHVKSRGMAHPTAGSKPGIPTGSKADTSTSQNDGVTAIKGKREGVEDDAISLFALNEGRPTDDEQWCRRIIECIRPVDCALESAAQGKIDNKTKPLGALGTLEDLALQMSLIQKELLPVINRKGLFVFAGDHGITEEGVSAYPSEVTRQMVDNFLNGGAAINVLCRHHHIDLKIVDMGVNGEFDPHPDLIDKKVRKGTRNFAIEPAMTPDEAWLALKNGMEIILQSHQAAPLDIVGVGEMGIGNTTSASAIISTICGISPAQAAGRGTGVDNKGLEHKIEVLERSLNFQRPDPHDGLDIVSKVGGFEIAGIAGAVLAAASQGIAVVLDGVISTAAGLLAYVMAPEVGDYLISGHKSVEVAQKAALDHMGLKPVIDFGMRLGEGTGAALTMDTAEAACKIMCEMASFDEAKVSGKK